MPAWGFGGVLIFAYLFVLGDAVAAKTASTILFGLALLAAGSFEIVHAFWVPHWGDQLSDKVLHRSLFDQFSA